MPPASPPPDGWSYEIGAEKLREFRSAVGIQDGTEIPPGFVFSYAVAPGLARILMHPSFTERRARLRLVGLEIGWKTRPRAHETLSNSVGFDAPSPHIACAGDQGAEIEVDVHLGEGDASRPATPVGPVLGERLQVDAGRVLAFAAATWDLNPAYWSERFARAAGLETPVVPPGLAASWVLQMIRRSSGVHPTRASLTFGRAARVGDELMARVVQSADASDFVVQAGDVPVCWGSCS